MRRSGQKITNADRPPDQATAVEGVGIEVQQALDLALQGDHIVLEDGDDLLLGGIERPGNLVLQQRDAFAQGGQRGLEFVRDVAQGALAIVLQFGQALPQPVQLPPELPEIGRPADRDRLVETLFPEPLDRPLEIAQGANQPPADGQHDEKRPGQGQRQLPAETQPAGLQFRQKRAVPDVDPVLAGALQQAVDLGQAIHDRRQLGCRRALVETAAQGFGPLPPFAEQRSERFRVERVEAVDHRQRLGQMVVETLADVRFLKHQKLPGAARHVDRAFAEFLDRSRHLQRLLAILAALPDEMFDHQPATQRRAPQQENDHREAGQQTLAERDSNHAARFLKNWSVDRNCRKRSRRVSTRDRRTVETTL